MAFDAEGGVGVVHDQKIAIRVGVRVVTGCALDVLIYIELQLVRDERGEAQLMVLIHKIVCVLEGDRMVVGQVLSGGAAQIGRSVGGDCGESAYQCYCVGSAV